MSNKLFKKALSIIVSICMLISPMTSYANHGEAEGIISSEKRIESSISEYFGSKGNGTMVTAMTEDSQGNYYVLGVTKAGDFPLIPEGNGAKATSGASQVFISKLDNNLNMVASTLLAGGGKEAIGEFGSQIAEYTAGDGTYGGPIAVDDDGNVYIAVRNAFKRNILEKDDLMYTWDDCYCWWHGDDGECYTDDEDPCPACQRLEVESKNFISGEGTSLELYKFDDKLTYKDKECFPFATALVKGNTTRPISLEIGSDGSIYVGGGTSDDLGFKNPLYPFNYFDDDSLAPGKKMDESRGFLVKINPGMTAVAASTYFGGPTPYNKYSGGSNSFVRGIVADEDSVYITGDFSSNKLPVHEGAYSKEYSVAGTSRSSDAYVARFDKDLTKVEAATYFGGTGSEYGISIKVSGNYVYIAGDTNSADMPTHESAYQRDLGKGFYYDAFIARLNKNLTKEGFAATYLGGDNRDQAFAFDINEGYVYVTGETYGASTFPTTDGSGRGRIFLSKLDSSLNTLTASTIIEPGFSSGQGRGISVKDSVYVSGMAGMSSSSNQPFISKYSKNLGHSSIVKIEDEEGFRSNPVYRKAGETIRIKVSFSTYVNVNTEAGTPRLKLNCSEDSFATYKYGSDSKFLIFEYTIKDGDTTQGQALDCYDENALDLNNGLILPLIGGSKDDVDLTVPLGSSGLPYHKIHINTIPSTIKGVSSEIENGIYSYGAVIPIIVTFSDSIELVDTKDGLPELMLNSGGKATYSGRGKSTELIFTYIVGDGDISDDLNYTDIDALNLNGGVINDNFGITPILSLPAPDSEGSLGLAKDIVIKSDAIRVLSVTSDASNQAFKEGSEVPITVNFNKKIRTTGKIHLNLNSKVGYQPPFAVASALDEPAEKIILTYKVKSGENVEVLDYSSIYALTLDEGAEILGEDGTPISLILPVPGGESSLSLANIAIDTASPTISRTSKASTPNYLKGGDKITMKFTFNEDVLIKDPDGEIPYVEMKYSRNDEKQRFIYESGQGTNEILFSYIVDPTDRLSESTGIVFEPMRIMPNGAFIDRAGNEAVQTFTISAMLNPFKSIRFDNTPPQWGTSSLRATYDETKSNVKLTWDKASDDNSGLDRYHIYRQIKETGTEREIGNKTSYYLDYTDDTVVQGYTYIYKVYVTDKAGNRSNPISTEIIIPGEKPTEDTEPPYWSDNATLTYKRLSSSAARLVFDPKMAADDFSEISAFKIYLKKGSYWEYIKTVDYQDADKAIVEGLDIDTDFVFKVEIVDAADLESIDGKLQITISKEAPYLTIKDLNSGLIVKRYILEDLLSLDYNQSWPNDSKNPSPIINQKYSAVSEKGGNIYKSYYAATGVTLDYLINDAGISEYKQVTVKSSDGQGISFLKDFLYRDRYYYLPDIGGKDPIKVAPIIAFFYNDSGSAFNEAEFLIEGEIPNGAGVPRFFYGQTSSSELNRENFVKDVREILVDFSDEPLYKEKPVITMNSDEIVYVKVGDKFIEPGVSAVDAYGKKVSDIVTSIKSNEGNIGKINTDKPGVFTVTYRATDQRGNVAEAERKVVVYEPIVPSGIYNISVDSNQDYTFMSNRGVPEITSTSQEEKRIDMGFTVDEFRGYGQTQTVILVHMRGSELVDIRTVVKDFSVSANIESSFLMQKGDKIAIFVVDMLSNRKGEKTEILYQ